MKRRTYPALDAEHLAAQEIQDDDGPAPPEWQVSADGSCHSLCVPGEYALAYPVARDLAYQRIGTLENGSLLHPPAIVGRGDHVYVELHVRVPAAVDATPVSAIVDHAIAGEGL